MNESAVKEDLSICYISAVSANAGIDYDTIRHDSDSTDGMIKCICVLDGCKLNVNIRVQLKSTSSPSKYQETDNEVRYPLKVKNYNDLCRRGTCPIILCLLVLPSDRGKWVSWNKEALLLGGCMYWTCLAGKKESSNKGTVTVTFDKKNVVNSNTLQELLEKVAREESLL